MSTKELAKKLGLVQKCNLSDLNKNTKNVTGQKFEYILVLDFESTCWEKMKNAPNEIIEFPVVLLELETGKILEEFHQYVFPVENPTLSEFCIKLTGISQEKLNEEGLPLPTTLYLFSKWLRKVSDTYGFSTNLDLSGKHAAFVTWSDWDLGCCLWKECKRKNMKKPIYFEQWIDIRAIYREFYGRSPQGLVGALKDLGMTFEGRGHSGIWDARNTAKLAHRMVSNGCQLYITKSYL